ncbi:MAG: protease modulator HflK [Oscillospiraceae bacterium]|jgi:membrane protease subunit HflK|nr:protease modulator HflK [Oscillospiraceae bacterium]
MITAQNSRPVIRRSDTFGGAEKAVQWTLRLVRPLIAALCALLLLSGVYVVQNDEVAVVLRFGKLVGANLDQQLKMPGIRIAFPPVIDEVVRIPVGKIRQITVATHYASSESISSEVADTGYLITGDQNIVLLQAVVQYQIIDPIAYALNFENIEGVISGVMSGVLREKASGMDVDSILTTGKSHLAELSILDAQARLDAIGCGVFLTSLDFTNLTPPAETMAEFEAVIAAGIKKETLIQQANEYRINTIPAAQSQARALVENARVARNEAVSAAQNDMAVFIGLYEQYKINPEIVIEGVLRARLNALMAKMQVIITPDAESAPRVLLP